MARSRIRSCVAFLAVMTAATCFGQKVDSLSARGSTVYWTKAGALYSWKITDPNNNTLQASGWSANSKIAVDGGLIYYTSAGDLVRKPLNNLTSLPVLLDSNGWDADSFCMANGHVYWSSQGKLFAWDLDPNHNHSVIGTTMVSGDSRVVVDGTHVYWVKGDDLMKAPLSNVDGGAQTANTGGWKATKMLAASKGVLYFTSGGDLYKTSLSNMNGSPPINKGGWD